MHSDSAVSVTILRPAVGLALGGAAPLSVLLLACARLAAVYLGVSKLH